MTAQLFPKRRKRKRQPTARMYREQLRMAADEIIRLQTRIDWLEMQGTLQVIAESIADMPLTVIIDGKPVVAPEFIIGTDGRIRVRERPRPAPWYRRLLGRHPTGGVVETDPDTAAGMPPMEGS